MSLSRHNPRTVNPFFSGFDDFFAPSPFLATTMFNDWMPVVPNFDRGLDNMILRRSSPGYEINENDTKYQIAMDVPGVKASDISAQLEHHNGGKTPVLHVSGGRKVSKDGVSTETKFEKRFTIGQNVDVSKLSANLADGVLTLSAPKVKIEEPEPMKIEITQNKAITDDEKKSD